MKNISKEQIESGFVIEDNKAINTLGLYWQPSTDTFRFIVNLPDPPKVVTKHDILSDITQLFDPIGIVSPIVITAKLLIKEIWLIKDLDWDQRIPDTLHIKWNN